MLDLPVDIRQLGKWTSACVGEQSYCQSMSSGGEYGNGGHDIYIITQRV